VLSAAVACGELGPDFDRVVAVEVSTPDSLEQLDTLRPRARALNGRGDSVAATILWTTLDTALLAVGNETTGKLVGKRPGADARIQARVGNLRINLILVDVLAAADTLVAPGDTADTVTVSAPDSLSDSLSVRADTTGGLAGLRGRPVVWAITAPTGAGSGSVTLVTDDTARALVTVDTVVTSGSGIAAIQVRLIADPRPDSAIVEARAQRAVGTTIPGSPVTFVVRFLP
jgi:hypothetical protein